MNINDVKNLLIELSTSKGDSFDIPVEVNGRLTRTLGRVVIQQTTRAGVTTAKPIKMEFSRQMLETVCEEDIISIIKHEWCHYYLCKVYQKNFGHNAVFKELCESIGTSGTTSMSVNRVVEVKSKYDVVCKCCGKVLGHYSRACKTTKNPEIYTSKCCGSSIEIIQNF